MYNKEEILNFGLQRQESIYKSFVGSLEPSDSLIIKAIETEEVEKGKRAQLGEIREWNGKKYQKTASGWVSVKGDNDKKPSKDLTESQIDGEIDRYNQAIKRAKAEGNTEAVKRFEGVIKKLESLSAKKKVKKEFSGNVTPFSKDVAPGDDDFEKPTPDKKQLAREAMKNVIKPFIKSLVGTNGTGKLTDEVKDALDKVADTMDWATFDRKVGSLFESSGYELGGYEGAWVLKPLKWVRA